MYRVHIELPQNQCNCKCELPVEVTQEELVGKLLKYNGNLTKYLSKYSSNGEEVGRNTQEKTQQQQKSIKKYTKSIIEEKGLNFLLPESKDKDDEEKKDSPIKSPKQLKEQQQQTDNIENKKGKKPVNRKKQLSKKQEQLQNYYKQVNQSSRYLSDTGFRKHFKRQCFENYGWNNTNGAADGIMYGNYMKTHNINPHSGYNMPIDEETFRNALVHANPSKYREYQHEKKVEQIRLEAEKNEKERMKYSRMKLLSPQRHQLENKYQQEKQVREQVEEKKIQTKKEKFQKMQRRKESKELKEIKEEKTEIKRQNQLKSKRESNQKDYRKNQIKVFEEKPVKASPRNQIEKKVDLSEKKHSREFKLPQYPETICHHHQTKTYNPPLVYLQERNGQCACQTHTFSCQKCLQKLKNRYVEQAFNNPMIVNGVLDYAYGNRSEFKIG